MKSHQQIPLNLAMCLAALAFTGCATRGPLPLPENAEFKSVSAKSFLLQDGYGSTRASLAIDGGDVVRMTIGNRDQGEVFLLSVFPDGRAALLLKDGHGQTRLGLSIQEDGRPVMKMSDGAAVILQDDRFRNRAVLNVHSNGTPALTLYDDQMRGTRFDAQRGNP